MSQDKETSDALIGLIVADVPIALRRLYGAQASQASFHKWRTGVKAPDGKTYKLEVTDIEGQGPSVIPSKLREFLITIGH